MRPENVVGCGFAMIPMANLIAKLLQGHSRFIKTMVILPKK
jgi:hypothetical protein